MSPADSPGPAKQPYTLTPKSLEEWKTLDPRAKTLLTSALNDYNFLILAGHRSEEDQNAAFASGKSKKKWPDGAHNKLPSLAFDAAPLPLDWGDSYRFAHFAGFLQGLASSMGVKLKWGGDWDGDHDFKDNTFQDLVHFELID